MIAIFPGSFDPPTYGHVEVVTRALEVFNELYIVCSLNPSKTERWFTPEECVEMWKSYNIPFVKIVTFNEMKNLLVSNTNIYKESKDLLIPKVIMVRGLRFPGEITNEEKVILDAYRDFNISNFHYIACFDLIHISSTFVKYEFERNEKLEHLVSTDVIRWLKNRKR